MYSCNRYYQAYLCAYDKIKYTTKSFKKNLSVIFKNHSFQFVPFLILSVYFCMDGYKDLISLDVIQYSEKTSANIYKDFDPSSESKIINSLYSQKIIDGDFLTKPKMTKNIEKKFASKKSETIISFNVHNDFDPSSDSKIVLAILISSLQRRAV